MRSAEEVRTVKIREVQRAVLRQKRAWSR